MAQRHLTLRLAVLAAVLLSWHAAPRAAAATAPGLKRLMFVSATYIDMVVELDGHPVATVEVNRLSDYIPIPSDRAHTLVLRARGLALPDKVIRRIPNYRTAPGPSGIEIYRDDGASVAVIDAPPAPPGKSLLHVIWGPTGSSEVRWGRERLKLEPNEAILTRVVEPQTALLELRSQTGRLVQSQYLRAQPGYRYEIIVPQPGDSDEQAQLVVTPVSPQLQARPTPTRVFTETGHYLDGRLGEYWEQTGGLPVFGYPLNDDHLERTPEGAFVTQVFERNRFEYHPEREAPYDVLLGRLGAERLEQLGRNWLREWQPRPIGSDCEALYAEITEFALCEPFRSYYHAHGLEFDGSPGFSHAESLALLGFPMTQAQMETNAAGDRVLTQWFERARLEYHPRNPRPFQVLQGRLGAELYGLEPLTFDDEDRGFQRWSAPGSADWNEAAGGFGGHYWWACTENLGSPKQEPGNFWARWTGPRPPRGTYEVQVFVPDQHAGSRSVPYTVRVSLDEGVVARLDQRPWSNAWVPLQTLELGSLVGVTAHSNTGEGGRCSPQLAVDAIRFVPRQ